MRLRCFGGEKGLQGAREWHGVAKRKAGSSLQGGENLAACDNWA